MKQVRGAIRKMKLNNRIGFYSTGSNMFYVEFDGKGRLCMFSGWPNNGSVSEAKKMLAKQEIEKINSAAYEIVYILDGGNYITVTNEGLCLLEGKDANKQLILIHPDGGDYYDRIYKNEIRKFLAERESISPSEFWEKMALEHKGITPDDAIMYIKDHVEEFRREAGYYSDEEG